MVIEDVMIETETSRGKQPVTTEVLVVSVRPKRSQMSRCSRCRRHCPGYDGGDGVRRWRTLAANCDGRSSTSASRDQDHRS
jgi:hypothetical protein